MTSPRSNNTRSNNPRSNRPMFRRLVRRLIFANRGRLFVILLALSAGAAVSAALLNLQTDAKRRINSEFQLFGPNVVITPKQSNNIPASTLDESILSQIRMAHAPSNQRVNSTAYLYLLADVSSSGHPTKTRMVVAGIHSGSNETPGLPEGVGVAPPEKQLCFIGQKAADQVHVTVGDHVTLHTELSEESCKVSLIVPHGDADDSQIFPHLDVAQRISGLVGRISLVQITVRGTPDQIDSYVMDLRSRIPDADVRPLRQFTEAQSKIYSRISDLLNAATAIILVLTALCVMAAMTNIAAERKRDVGMPGHDDHGHFCTEFLEFFEQLQAVDAGHSHVTDDTAM